MIATAFPIQTRNGGLSWSVQKSISEVNLSSIYALDENYIFVAGDNKIFKTTNGGLDWENVSPDLSNRNYTSLWFRNPDHLIDIFLSQFYQVRKS